MHAARRVDPPAHGPRGGSEKDLLSFLDAFAAHSAEGEREMHGREASRSPAAGAVPGQAAGDAGSEGAELSKAGRAR